MKLLSWVAERLKSMRFFLRAKSHSRQSQAVIPANAGIHIPIPGGALSTEQFRAMLIEALDDPATARMVAKRLVLPVFPVQGGAACSTSPGDIKAGDFNCAGNYTFSTGNVGIGTTSPGATLHVVGSELRLQNNDSFYSAYNTAGSRLGYLQWSVSIGHIILENETASGGALLRVANTSGVAIVAPNVNLNPQTPLDVRGSNPMATTAAFQNILEAASTDSSNPLALRAGIKTDATASNRYGAIEVDDAGTKRPLALQPSGGNVGVGTTSPVRPLHVSGGDAAVEEGGGFGFHQSGSTDLTTVLYRAGGTGAGKDVTILRNYNVGQVNPPLYTNLTLRGPKDSTGTASREATLSLIRVDSQDRDMEYVDHYNNGYPNAVPQTEVQFGIRIQKSNSGSYRDFIFDQYDGVVDPITGNQIKFPIMRLKADRTVELQSHADTNSWTNTASIHATGVLKTTSSTAATLATISLASPRVYHIVVRVAARQSDGSLHALFYRAALVYNESGTASIVGQADVIAPLGGTGWTCTLSASGANILVQVQGATSATVYWAATIEYQSVSTDS